MMFYKKYGFAFQHVNRTGGWSIKKALLDTVGNPDKGSTIVGDAHRPLVDCIEAFKEHHPGHDINNLAMYANVRGPFARIVSIFSYRSGRRGAYKGKSFKWFFYNIYMGDADITDGSTKPFMVDETGEIPWNMRIFKFEDLPVVWPSIILRHFNRRIHSFPMTNASKHGDPRSYFDNEMIKIVIEKEHWLIERFYPELLEMI